MAVNFSDTLVVGISSTALFDLTEADAVFRAKQKDDPDTAIKEYREYMLTREDEPLGAGTGLPLVQALLKLNKFQKEKEPPLVEVVVMSRNSPETGLRILNTIRSLGLPISRSAFTGGQPVTPFLDAFDVDLFLTTRTEDAQGVADRCAVAVLRAPPDQPADLPDDVVRFAFDGDAVLFSEDSEVVYKTKGLKEFHSHEDIQKEVPLAEGPHATLLKKLARLQERLPYRVEYSPVRIALVTARNSPADIRVVKTLRKWGVYVDEAFFLGGVDKGKVLEALRPHIFFDDQDVHLDAAAKHVPSGKVPYRTGSLLSDEGAPVVERPPAKVVAE